jgi:hypothetical protein
MSARVVSEICAEIWVSFAMVNSSKKIYVFVADVKRRFQIGGRGHTKVTEAG